MVSTCPMRRSGPGATGSGRSTRTSCAVVVRGQATNGTSMRCFVSINGAQWYLWRAVDQHGKVLDILVRSRRNAVAARKFFRRLLTGLRSVPMVIGTAQLASYQVAHRELMPSVPHRRSKYLNRHCHVSERWRPGRIGGG